MNKKRVLLLGLSNKPHLKAFDSTTNSGKLIDMIISQCKNFEFTKANLVEFAPLDTNNKLRYPTEKELLCGADVWSNKISEFYCIVLFLISSSIDTEPLTRTSAIPTVVLADEGLNLAGYADVP